jgi:hypothetical protein
VEARDRFLRMWSLLNAADDELRSTTVPPESPAHTRWLLRSRQYRRSVSRITRQQVASVEKHERGKLERRAHLFRAGRPRIALDGRTVVVDYGIATGLPARAACHVARA